MTSQHVRALLLANGEPPSQGLWQSLCLAQPDIFCVDGGANAAVALGAHPRAVYGDFDSVQDDVRNLLACDWHETSDQEYQDLDKAVGRVLNDGYTNISVAGALGRLPSHTFANLGVLVKYKDEVSLTYHGEQEDLFLLEGLWEWKCPGSARISLLPMFGPTRITTTNLLYPLHDEVLCLGLRDGLSNRTTVGRVQVVARENPVLVCIERGEGVAPFFAPEK